MGIIRPATPGFLVTTLATVLLLVVSFSVPWFKSVYFLKAQVSQSGQSGFITFGVLGYCTSVNGGSTNCTSAKLGYEFDPNALLGDNIKFLQIPTVVVKWITWTLVLHIIAFALAAISALFGLLAHIREFAMTCFSSCIAGIAAVVALFAFIFDLVLFFTVKSRINHVNGGSAVIGNAVWLTLASWLLLFFSGCFYTIGRCCITRRPRAPREDNWNRGDESGRNAPPKTDYAELMRLDAVKAEADRKARQAAGERGLPAFPTLEERKPLSNYEATYVEDDDDAPASPYRDTAAGVAAGRVAGPRSPRRNPTNHSDYSTSDPVHAAAAATGYTPGQPGSRTIDQYNNPVNQTGYPPQTPSRMSQRQPSRGPSTSPAPQASYQNYGNQQQSANYSNVQPQVASQNPYGKAPTGGYGTGYSPQGGYAGIAAAAGVAGAGVYAAHQAHQNSEYDAYPYDHTQAQASSYQPTHGQDQTTYHSSYTHPQDFTQHNEANYASDPFLSMPNPHDATGNPSPHSYGSTYPSSNNLAPQNAPSSHQTPYYTPATGGSGGYLSSQANRYDTRPDSSGTSYFPYGGGGETDAYEQQQQHGGLHTVQEASGSTNDHPPGYTQGSYAQAGWAEKS